MKYCFLFFCFTVFSIHAADKPNILFIMSDDHTTQAFGIYGSRLAALNMTPNLDLLANQGIRFDRVYCNNAICTPSRASIITGQYSQTNGILDLRASLPTDKQYLPIEMKRAGYETAMIGKWHLKNEPQNFDYYCVLPGQGKYFNPEFRLRGERPWPENTMLMTGTHSSDAITDISLEWLREKRDTSKAFFMMHHFKAPHDMFENAPRYDSYLEDVIIPEPVNLHNQPAKGFGSAASRPYGAGVTKAHPSWGLGKKLGIDQSLSEPAYGKAVYQKYLKRYLRCVKGVDDNVKRLIDFLKESGVYENTVVIYTGDQGFLLGEHDFMDKRWMYEESMRMPLIIHYPKIIKRGSVNNWLINNTDFAPTILALAGIQTPGYMQGISFLDAIEGNDRPANWRKVTYYRYWMHMAHKLRVPAHFGIRGERYKLIFFYGTDKDGSSENSTPAAWELYDMSTDPHEMNNLYDKPAYASLIGKMKQELKDARLELGEQDMNEHILAIIDKNWDK
ncbi:MAG: sulfatase [Saprospiraceae bacterium]|nr:sulfatase [Saprospiraceae bacterium]